MLSDDCYYQYSLCIDYIGGCYVATLSNCFPCKKKITFAFIRTKTGPFIDLKYVNNLSMRKYLDPSKRGMFDVRSFYNVDSTHFPRKIIWQNKVPLRVAFFVWTIALGKIVTMDSLRKQRVIVVDWCCMYKRSEKFVHCLLLHCEIARALWSAIFSLVGLVWIMLKRVVNLFACWRGLGGSSHSAVVWKIVMFCLLWCLGGNGMI
jgi:hypothetical protein